MMNKVDYKLKISLLGEAGVGKTSLILRYVKNFFKEDLRSTIGTNFMTKPVDIDGLHVHLLIYDIGAQKMFTTMRAKYFQGSNGAIAVYDITRQESLLALPNWVESIRTVCGGIPVIIVGNKIDLEDERQVNRSDGEALASRFDCMFTEASAKTGERVEAIFERITRAVLEDLR